MQLAASKHSAVALEHEEGIDRSATNSNNQAERLHVHHLALADAYPT
jgi:hypothetical protein